MRAVAEPTAWLRTWFAAPVPPQGPAPADWTPLEADLHPDACGACHVQQALDWRTSLHASAMGPGVLGQLRDWDGGHAPGADDDAVQKCQRCHAPLAEQAPRSRTADGSGAGEDWSANADFIPDLREEGVTCAACHVRAWRRAGPPRADGAAPMADAPHGGFDPRPELRDPAFCAPCHDFSPGQRAFEGKLLQETGAEWARTAAAASGQTCQSCHMPDGRHLWRGVHDPETLQKAIGVTAVAAMVDTLVTASLTVTNIGAAHRLPTYSTPQLTLTVEQLTREGVAIPGTATQRAIARYVKPDLSAEVFDTRLLPGEHLTLDYQLRRAPAAVAVRARVECWPDEAYRRFYTIKLRDPAAHPLGRAELEAALARTTASRFIAWEQILPLPAGP